MYSVKAEVLIVGGGAAGLSAALAASDRAPVTLVDDNPYLGGQIWRAELGRIKSPDAASLIEAVSSGKVNLLNSCQVFAAASDNTLLAETDGRTAELEFEKLIIATGARERFLPFPGWTLTNVFGAGGLQALAKGGWDVRGKRIVVAGTGALLLAVADNLKAKGAEVLLIAEQAPASRINRFALSLWSSPSKIFQATSLRKRLLGTPYLTGCWITAANGNGKVESVTIKQKGKERIVECDMVACGFHLVPNTEVAQLLGCEIDMGFVVADKYQRTSRDNIYCAGEPTGIGGLESSLIEGTIAGLSATGQTTKAERHFNVRAKTRRFGDALNRAFELRDELRTLATSDTIVCRCEDVVYGSLAEFDNSREAKLQTRCGMGPCQGRICGAATEFLFGWTPGTVRAPIFPVKLEDL